MTSIDDEIAAHLAAGEHEAAATKLIEGQGPTIVEYLCAVLRDEDAAFDVFGHFCEELWKSIATFRGESAFKTWTYTLVMRSVSWYRRDGFRKRGRQLGSAEISALVEQMRSSTPPYQRTEIKDTIAKLREALEPEEQALLFLRVDQNLSWNEVAAILSEEGEPVEAAALRKRFERAKTKLKKLAEAEGLLGDE